jgi:hypothetical protein
MGRAHERDKEIIIYATCVRSPNHMLPHEVRITAVQTASGLALMLYFSQTFNPPAAPTDTREAEARAYSNAYAGVWAVVLAFLGGRCIHSVSGKCLTLWSWLTATIR